MTEEQREQIAGEIENQGFEYWLVNYASSSLPDNNAPQDLIELAERAAAAISEVENAFMDEGLLY